MENKSEVKKLKEIHSVLDKASGDSDIISDCSDDELKQEDPLCWCGMNLMRVIKSLEKQPDYKKEIKDE